MNIDIQNIDALNEHEAKALLKMLTKEEPKTEQKDRGTVFAEKFMHDAFKKAETTPAPVQASKQNKRWNDTDVRYIFEHANDDIEEVARVLGRTNHAISNMRHTLGINARRSIKPFREPKPKRKLTPFNHFMRDRLQGASQGTTFDKRFKEAITMWNENKNSCKDVYNNTYGGK